MSIVSRIDAVTNIEPEFLATVCPPPPSCKIELTSRCSLRCSFCANTLIEDKADMEWGTYTKLVDELVAFGVKELGVFYIGESFMVDWLTEAIKYAKDAGIEYVFITTNGTHTSPEKVSACMKAGLDSLKFSLNYANEAQFAEVARVKPKLFHRAIENIKAARKVRDEGGYSCKIYASSIRFTGEQQDKMRLILDEVMPYLDEHYELPLFSFSDDAVVDREEELGWKPVGGNPGRADCMRPPLPCWAGFKEMHIDRNGNLNYCCFGGDEFIMGNALEVGVANAWNSQAFQALRAKHLAGDVRGTVCQTCIYGK